MRPIVPCAAFVLLASFGASARADEFLQQEGDLWRASKLVGVNIYGPDNKKVGDVSDVLMGRDGKATYIVVGVGGVLGIGQKDVAIPFDKVKFTQEAMPLPAPPVGTMAPAAGTVAPANTAATGGAMTGSAPGAAPGDNGTAPAALAPNAPTGLGTPAVTTATGAVAPAGGMPAMPMAPRSTAYPDHGTVEYTFDQLKAAPTFAYAK